MAASFTLANVGYFAAAADAIAGVLHLVVPFGDGDVTTSIDANGVRSITSF